MGILVRLVTSMVGAFAGLAGGAVFGGLAGWGLLYGFLAFMGWGRFGPPGSPAPPFGEGALMLLIGGFLGIPAVIAAWLGAEGGYRAGLKVGRQISAAGEPEQHSRVDVNINHSNKS